jgi:hypothetical protein
VELEGMRSKEKRAPVIEPATVPLWPDAGRLLGLGRNATYEAAARGEIPIVPIGKRKRVLKKVLARMVDPRAV